MNPKGSLIGDQDIPFLSVFAGRRAAGEMAHPAADRANENDRELIESFLSGDEGSFAALVERHIRMTYKFVYRYVNSADDANDVVQDVFIKAWKHLRRFDLDRNFKTWLLTIAKNTALDFLKKKRPVRFSQIEAGDGDLDSFLAPYVAGLEADLPDEALEKKEVKARLEEALAGLSPAYQTVLSLRYREHLKFREIAELLGEPLDTVKSQHRRGVILLHKALGGAREEFSF